MERLTSSQILLLYRELTGEMELISPSKIVSIADRPYTKDEEGFYVYKSIAMRAAMLGYGIVNEAPFNKMNVEIAGLAILTLLELNNRHILQKDIDIQEFMDVLRRKDYDLLVEWLEDKILKKKQSF